MLLLWTANLVSQLNLSLQFALPFLHKFSMSLSLVNLLWQEKNVWVQISYHKSCSTTHSTTIKKRQKCIWWTGWFLKNHVLRAILNLKNRNRKSLSNFFALRASRQNSHWYHLSGVMRNPDRLLKKYNNWQIYSNGERTGGRLRILRYCKYG